MFSGGDSEKKFSCIICGADGFTQTGMEQHLKQVHCPAGSNSDQGKASTAKDCLRPGASCPFCNFTTPAQESLQTHITTKHLEQNVCPLCDIVFSTPDQAERHMTSGHVDLIGDHDENTVVCCNGRETDQTVGESEGNQKRSFSDTVQSNNEYSSCQSLRLSDGPQDSSVGHVKDAILLHDSFEDMESDDADEKIIDDFETEQNTKFQSNRTAMKQVLNNKSAFAKSVGQDPACSQSAKSTDCTCGSSELGNKESFQSVDSGISTESASGSQHSSITLSGDRSFSCPFCPYQTASESAINVHVNSQHMSPDDSFSALNASLLYTCPFCEDGFDSPSDLAYHVNRVHPEEEVGAGSSDASGGSDDVSNCPVCGLVIKGSAGQLAAHVNEHFQSKSRAPSEDLDRKMAERLQDQEKKRAQNETQAFKQMQEQFGMDTSMTARQQFDRNLERAVTSGRMTVEQAHDKKVKQVLSDVSGVDDGSTQVSGIIERLQSYYSSASCPRSVLRVYLCDSTSHYSSSYGDRGWGCGYRNFQMLLSCLAKDATFLEVLFSGVNRIPSVSKLQRLIENAWQKGFDPQGSHQLGGRVVNTRKWIGATEIVATLGSLRVKCQLLDFHAPSGPENTHPVMINWVRDYFKNSAGFTPPLYLQHQGHSRTIIGVEELKNGGYNLLLFDPGTAKARMEQFFEPITYNTLQAIRKTPKAFRAQQYQIVAIVGILNDREYEAAKYLQSTKLS